MRAYENRRNEHKITNKKNKKGNSVIFFEKLVHIPQELRIRSRGTERHSASN